MARVWLFGDDVNTDLIFPGRYLKTVTEPEGMAECSFGTVRPGMAGSVHPGDVIVAGNYFGCGSSREQAAICLAGLGLAAIVAGSFARIFYRNAINQGIPLIVCPEAAGVLEDGCDVEVDTEAGTITLMSDRKKVLAGEPLSPFARSIVDAGGLVPFIRRRIQDEGRP